MTRIASSIVLVILTMALLACSCGGYTGTVSEIKGVRAGVVIHLEGHYPNQKMTLYIPSETASRWDAVHPGWPRIGMKVKATGAVIEYRGRTEIVIEDPKQVTW